jgi:potassium efflux system protein
MQIKQPLCRIFPGILLLFLPLIPAWGQEPAARDTTEAAVQPIPAKNIIIRATEVNTLLREKRAQLLTLQQKEDITARTDTLRFRLALLREDPRIHKTQALTLRSLDNMQSEWSFLNNQLVNEQQRLNSLLQSIESQRREINALLSTWELTSNTVTSDSAVQLVINQIGVTLKDIRETQTLFVSDSKFIQEMLVVMSSKVIFTNEILQTIQQAKQEVTRSLLSIDGKPIWKELRHKNDTIIVFREQRSIIEDSMLGFRDFFSQYSLRVWIHLFLSLTLMIMVFILFRTLRHTIPDSDTPEIRSVKRITERPLAAGWLIAVVISFLLYPSNLPDVVVLLISLLLLPPAIVILRAVITGDARTYIYLPLVAMILVELNRMGYSETLMSRLWIMLITLFSILPLALIFGRKSQREKINRVRFGRFLVIVSFVAFILLVVAFFANILGAITLSEFLTYSVIESATVTLFLYAFVAIFHSIIATIVHSNYMQKSSILSQHQGLIFKRLKGIINVIGIVLLVNFIFRIFNIWDPVYTWVKNVFSYNLKVGSMEFTLWNITLFLVIIWLTLWISRIVRTFFESEAALRDRMRRGAPGAVSLLLRISIITIGFLIAVAAAGLQLDKLAIVLGAFGVGIGFGLQNIFNNLVSGIILAFERPIKDGDIIEVGSLLGIVKEIGIRSSVIRTYDGSEVIVPNGNLISNELINWTRSDLRRRGEVNVGVAYGTDPRKVISLLLEAARNYDHVLRDPEPLALFTGFGDSSLDFRLLFWIADADMRYVLQSEMAVRVNQAITDAGITIPFPQRDLHVISVDNKILDRINAQDEIARKQKGKLPPEK